MAQNCLQRVKSESVLWMYPKGLNPKYIKGVNHLESITKLIYIVQTLIQSFFILLA